MRLTQTILFGLIVFLFPFQSIFADEGFITGATAASGVIYSTKDHESVSMNREIIYFDGFYNEYLDEVQRIPLAKYKVLFEFENASPQVVAVPCSFPVNVFFTEFGVESRSNILDNLATIMPDLFDFSKNEKTIAYEMREKFKNRNFIRRVMNVRDLDKLNMAFKIYQDDKEVKINKIMLEFKWVVDKEKNMEFLVMETHLIHDLSFMPSSKSYVTVEYVVPAFNTGNRESNYFSPYITGTGRTWKDNIKEIYIVNNVMGSTVTLPYYVEFEQMNFGFNKHVTIIRNHEPEKNEKIGFYTSTGGDCGCYRGDALSEPVYFPISLKNINASSWFNQPRDEKKVCLHTKSDLTVVKWVPDFETGLYNELSILRKPLLVKNHSAEIIKDMVEVNCGDDGEPYTRFLSGYHPIWAFDLSKDSLGTINKEKGNFGTSSGWCVYDAGGGKGQYIEFEISQEINEIKFFTGMHKSEAEYKKFNRVKLFELVQQDGNHKQLLMFSDMLSSSYELKLKPGIYRMYIKDIYEGKEKNITCFSSIYFSFSMNDDWFNTYVKKL
jgi:hypothetical protein